MMVQEMENSAAAQDDIVQFSSFYLDDTMCGIDIASVQEIKEDINITKVPLSPPYVVGIMNLRGQIVTVINQSMKIGFEASKIGKDSRVIIVKSQEEYIGMLVDKVTEVIAASRKEIAEPPSNIKGAQGKYFHGIVHTENNELMAILNVDEVLAQTDN